MIRTRLNRAVTARRRVAASFLIGVVACAVAALFAPWQLAALIGFDSAAIVQLLWIWLSVGWLDGEATSEVATREDNSRATASLVVNATCVISLLGVAFALVKAKQSSTPAEVALTTAAIVTVVLAWFTVHTTFVLRYAHLYYRGPDGGVDFQQEGLPDYRDFAYLGFTIGMTYQVSDTNITDRSIRRTATRHALISFLFGTVIIGLTINVMAGFVR